MERKVGTTTRHARMRSKPDRIVGVYVAATAERDGSLVRPLPQGDVVDAIAPDRHVAGVKCLRVATTSR